MRKQAFLVMVLVGLCVVALASLASAQALGPVHRFSAEFQFTPGQPAPEIITTLPPAPGGAGGKVVYSKTLFIPFRTLFVSFSATGDTHQNAAGVGAALLMTCLVDGVVCQSGGGLFTAGPSGWITLQKMPFPNAGSNNCNDGGGGSGDCHDNNLNYTWCTTVDGPGARTVELKLASSNGGIVFYERAHIYIDATPNKNADDGCVPAAVVKGSTTLP